MGIPKPSEIYHKPQPESQRIINVAERLEGSTDKLRIALDRAVLNRANLGFNVNQVPVTGGFEVVQPAMYSRPYYLITQIYHSLVMLILHCSRAIETKGKITDLPRSQ